MGRRLLGSGAKTGELVLSAISKLTTRTCWTARTIIKFIKMEFKISDPRMSSKIARVLKKGVKVGLLEADQNRYRLRDVNSFGFKSEDKFCKPKQTRRPISKRAKPCKH